MLKTSYKNIDIVTSSDLNFNPKIKGEYNLQNIYLAARVCADLGVSGKTIINAVNGFCGVPRRYEFIGNIQNTKIYIDYAHHPTEVKAFIETFLNDYKSSLIVFQPHTYSRTKTFIKEFVEIFSKIENVVIYKEYAARERCVQGMSAKELWLNIKALNNKVEYCTNIKKISHVLTNYSAVAFVGAGNINLVAQSVIDK